MASLILSILLIGQVLPADSVLDAGLWTTPENILVSDNLYAIPSAQNDNLDLRIVDPTDTTGTLDSVYVYLEQHVSDTTKGFWNVTAMFNGVPGTTQPDQPGTLQDAILGFNITVDISGWSDIYELDVRLTPTKGAGVPPEWYADHIYVYVFANGLGIEEGENETKTGLNLSVPTLVRNNVMVSYTLHAPSSVSIEVFNIAGMSIFKKNIKGTAGTNHVTLNDAGDLNTGIYYIRTKAIDSNGEIQTESAKFIMLD